MRSKGSGSIGKPPAIPRLIAEAEVAIGESPQAAGVMPKELEASVDLPSNPLPPSGKTPVKRRIILIPPVGIPYASPANQDPTLWLICDADTGARLVGYVSEDVARADFDGNGYFE